MKKAIWSSTFAALAFSGAMILAAQNPPGSQTSPAPQAPPSATPQTQSPPAPEATTPQAGSSESKVTVSGCLKLAAQTATTAGASTASPTGTAGSAEARANAGTAEPKYLLEKAMPADQPASANSSNRSYLLIANDAALAPHVGKQLEVTGTIDDQGRSSSARAGGADSPSSTPRLTVESGKILPAPCSN